MIIDRLIEQLIVHGDDPILAALEKIDANQRRFILIVDDNRRLEGVLTDGDVRRWLIENRSADLSQPALSIARSEFCSARQGESSDRIARLFSERIQFIPIVDDNGHLVAVARPRNKRDSFTIGPYRIDDSSPVFVIAEIGINHNGKPELARQLVDEAITAGADCVKFQMRDMPALYRGVDAVTGSQEDLGTQYTLDLLSRFNLPPEEMLELFRYCLSRNIFFFCTPWDLSTLALLENFGMQAYKVASADLTNHDLLAALAATGKPLICSTGMSTEAEIIESVQLLRRAGAKYALMHCNSTYPPPLKDLNLRYLSRLREIGGCPVGYSGHERGWHIAVTAVACGAKIIEKHITIDRSLEGNDHEISLLPEEFSEMVARIREAEAALGHAGPRILSQGETMNRANLAKSVIASRAVSPGEIITADMLSVKSPGRGMQPNRKKDLIGRPARRSMQPGDFFYLSDLGHEVAGARHYRFRRPWGLPVRFHDYRALLAKSNPDFLEFHLSYKDIDLNPAMFFDRPFENIGFTVHSPDLFAGDHLLNLADPDIAYRNRSLAELQRVIDLTRAMKGWFPPTTRPLIIVSLGGYTRDRLLEKGEREESYARIEAALKILDTAGVEIIAQTLPPFPWYFGGQLFLSLFMEASDTRAFCERTGMRLCFDCSHSMLACNHFKWSFKEFTDTLARHTAHLHIADATGDDGEGIQVGEGNVDFFMLA